MTKSESDSGGVSRRNSADPGRGSDTREKIRAVPPRFSVSISGSKVRAVVGGSGPITIGQIQIIEVVLLITRIHHGSIVRRLRTEVAR